MADPGKLSCTLACDPQEGAGQGWEEHGGAEGNGVGQPGAGVIPGGNGMSAVAGREEVDEHGGGGRVGAAKDLSLEVDRLERQKEALVAQISTLVRCPLYHYLNSQEILGVSERLRAAAVPV